MLCKNCRDRLIPANSEAHELAGSWRKDGGHGVVNIGPISRTSFYIYSSLVGSVRDACIITMPLPVRLRWSFRYVEVAHLVCQQWCANYRFLLIHLHTWRRRKNSAGDDQQWKTTLRSGRNWCRCWLMATIRILGCRAGHATAVRPFLKSCSVMELCGCWTSSCGINNVHETSREWSD